MSWHRFYYTFGPVDGLIDVMAETPEDAQSYDTWRAIHAQHPGVDEQLPVELLHTGDGTGEHASAYTRPAEVGFEMRVTKGRADA